jgi:hypothetical protein
MIFRAALLVINGGWRFSIVLFCSISEMLIHGSNDLEELAVETGE